MKKQVIKGKNWIYLFSPHKSGIGITYTDTRFNTSYDIGMCSTSRGKCLITWGLNADPDNLVAGCDYVRLESAWSRDGNRGTIEAILDYLTLK